MTPDPETGWIGEASISVPTERYILSIQGDNSQMLVRIHADGTMEFGSDYHPDTAAKIFWDAVKHYISQNPI